MEDLAKLEKEMEELKDAVSDLKEVVDEIKSALLDNKLTKQKGLIARIADIDSRLSVLEKLKEKAIYISIGIGVSAGFSISQIIQSIIALAAK